MMDWIGNFETRFGKDPEINSLKAKKFRGSLQIHFDNGMPLKYKKELWGTGVTIMEYDAQPNERS